VYERMYIIIMLYLLVSWAVIYILPLHFYILAALELVFGHFKVVNNKSNKR